MLGLVQYYSNTYAHTLPHKAVPPIDGININTEASQGN